MHMRVASLPAVPLIVLVAIVLPLLGACGSASTNVVGPSATTSKCQLTIASTSKSFPSNGGSGTVTISTGRECSWTASSDSAWLSFTSSASGLGSATLTFAVAANGAAAARAANVQVNDQRLQVSEEAAPCRFQLDKTSESVPAAGDTSTVNVSTLAGCTWSASSGVGWVSVSQGPFNGSAAVRMTVSANTGAARSAELSIAGTSFMVEQQPAIVAPAPAPPTPTPAPAPAPPPAPSPTPTPAPPPPPTPVPPPPPPPCTYTISPTDGTVPSGGGSVSVTVNTGSACAWTATSQANWLAVGTDRGSGNGTVTLTVAANTTANSRTATALIAGLTFTVTQEGLPQVDVVGTVSNVSGGCPALTFVVSSGTADAAGTAVTTGAGTQFTGGACKDVQNGARVHVTGVVGADGRVAASTVQIQKKAKG